MTGVVLSGGQSKRMGTDKGMIITESKSWVNLAFEKLDGLCKQVVVSVNPSQLPVYTEYVEANLVPDDPSIQVNGPLHGLLSVHTKFPAEDLLVLACDMVGMHSMVLENLIESQLSQPGFEMYVYNNDDGYQPTAAIYSASLLEEILLQSRMGILGKFSLKHIIENSNAFVLPVSDQWNPYFVNYNFKEDIDFQ